MNDNKPTYLMFIRHGETVGNQEQIAHGQSESPLTQRGIAQALCTAQMLTDWQRTYDQVVASPLSRAFDTGKHISTALDLPIATHDGLQEGFLGDWEAVTYQQLGELGYAKHSIKDDDFSGHNGESPNQLATRMINAITEIRSKHVGENIIIVSHGAAIAHAVASLLGTRPAFGFQYLMHNTAVTEIALGPEPTLEHLNFHDHLPEHLKVDPLRADQNRRK
jgi:broad specificity phosphatase PhoE